MLRKPIYDTIKIQYFYKCFRFYFAIKVLTVCCLFTVGIVLNDVKLRSLYFGRIFSGMDNVLGNSWYFYYMIIRRFQPNKIFFSLKTHLLLHLIDSYQVCVENIFVAQSYFAAIYVTYNMPLKICSYGLQLGLLVAHSRMCRKIVETSKHENNVIFKKQTFGLTPIFYLGVTSFQTGGLQHF